MDPPEKHNFSNFLRQGVDASEGSYPLCLFKGEIILRAEVKVVEKPNLVPESSLERLRPVCLKLFPTAELLQATVMYSGKNI